jgi:hypothetical protein
MVPVGIKGFRSQGIGVSNHEVGFSAAAPHWPLACWGAANGSGTLSHSVADRHW